MRPSSRSKAAPEQHILHKPYLVRLAVALGVVVATGLVAANGVPSWERSIFDAIYALPGWIDPVLWAPMQLGSLFGPAAVAIGSWLAWQRWRPTAGAAVVGVTAWFAAKVVKDIVDRGRPAALIPDLQRRTGAPLDGLGYLSGHATVAFALATVVSPYVRKPAWRAVVFGVATLVAFARVHVGAHLPLDVVGGAALGCAFGWLWHVIVGVPESVARRPAP